MLGVVTVAADDPADQLLREFGREIGADRTYAKTRVGVYFGTPGETVADPFFGGAGPARTGCIACGRCMVGCPHNAKNTLPKNYLWLAERAGARIIPERTVVDIAPLGAPDGVRRLRGHDRAHGRLVPPRPPHAHGARRRRRRRPARDQQAARRLQAARLAAAGLGPAGRARAHELRGDPRGHAPARRAGDDQARRDLLERLPGSRHAHRDRHLRRRGRLDERALHADGRRRHRASTRPLKLLGALLRHPVRLARITWPRGWSRRTVIVLVMQSLDNAIALRARRTRTRRRAAHDRAGPRAAEPDVHPGRQPVRGVAGRAHGRRSRRARSWRRWRTSRRPRTSSAAR